MRGSSTTRPASGSTAFARWPIASARPIVAVSRGSHIVVDSRFLPGERALMIPRTSDGRVLFAIPWLGHLIVGTTDVPTDDVGWEPQPTPAEIDFIVETARGYLRDRDPNREDITSTFAGLRPLVAHGARGETKTLSREHTIVIEHSNLITVTGGKWTTYRRMAFDALEQAARRGPVWSRSPASPRRCASMSTRRSKRHAARRRGRGPPTYQQCCATGIWPRRMSRRARRSDRARPAAADRPGRSAARGRTDARVR